jgi:hypothetical protein
MKDILEIKQNNRLSIVKESNDGFAAYIIRPYKLGQFGIIASWGAGWEHVSASMKNRCPTWDEMCMVKDIFWGADECVIQYHPPKDEYVNLHPHCLHLWKKIGSEFETPPKKLVG